MPSASLYKAQEERKNAWREFLHIFAQEASKQRKRWHPYPWLVVLAKRIQKAILKGGARLIVNAPPRHGKSELVSHWLPTWYLNMWPAKTIILTSYGGDFASEWGKRVRDEFVMNPLMWTRLRPDSKAVSSWLTTEGGGMKCAGVGGPITGRGADLAIIDDPHKNWEEAMSPEARARVVDWFNSTLYTRLEPGANIVVIQTRWHEADLTGYLLDEHQDAWQLVKFPALAEGEDDILGRAEGEALCPHRFPADVLDHIRKIQSSYLFAGLYQQRPAPLQGGMVRKDWFKYYDLVPALPDEWLQTWDLTFKATGTSYVVGNVWCRKDGNFYLVERLRDKLGFIDQLRAIQMMSTRWPEARTKVIEDSADAQAVKETLHDAVPGIVLAPAKGSKEARLAAVLGLIESGNVYLPAKADWLDEFVGEVTTFPNSVNDDQVDAMTLALDRLSVSMYDLDISLPVSGVRSSPWSFANA